MIGVCVFKLREYLETNLLKGNLSGEKLHGKMGAGENKMDTKKALLIAALVTVFICGCPGCLLIFSSASTVIDVLSVAGSDQDLWLDVFFIGVLQGGWMLCLGGLMIFVPLILLVIGLVLGNKKKISRPSGVSGEGPIPPTS